MGERGSHFKATEAMRDLVQSTVNESRLPNQDYETTVGVYGGKLKLIDRKLVFDMRGTVSRVDQEGDAILRTFDEHIVKDPIALLRRHPTWFMRFLAPGTRRYRGSPREIAENAERLGLEGTYALHQHGIEVKDQDLYAHGIPLQDIYRSDQIASDNVSRIDRFEALAAATEYIANVHAQHGGIGELLPSDVIFSQREERGPLKMPVLNLPDIMYNEKKLISENGKKATDLLDFLWSIAVEEMRRSEGDPQQVEHALRTILDHYSDKQVVALTRSFAKRGRLTLQGDASVLKLPDTAAKVLRPVLGLHNEARLGARKGIEAELRALVINVCDETAATIVPKNG